MKSGIARWLVPWSGLGVGGLAVAAYFCGHAQTGVCILACAVLLIGMGVLAFVAMLALSWLLSGLVRGVSRFGPPPAIG